MIVPGMIVWRSLITHYQPTDGRRISVTKDMSDEFGVTERTLQRDFHQRLFTWI